jgi:hypothetical protein
MNPQGEVRYRVNDRDEITYVDEGWGWFAQANDAPNLTGPQVLGRSLWDFISDATTHQLYRQVLDRVRLGFPVQFPLRCDGPSCRRWLEMSITSFEIGQIEFMTRLVRLEVREPVLLLAQVEARSNELLRACGWCNRVHIGDAWVEVENAIQQLRLFEWPRLPQLTHGICEMCFQTMMQTLDRMAR